MQNIEKNENSKENSSCGMKKTYSSILRTWKKNIKNLSDDNINENLELIKKFIIENKFLSKNSKKTHLALLLKFSKFNENKEFYDQLKKITNDLRNEIENEEKKNELDEDELNNWVSYDQLLEFREYYKKAYYSDKSNYPNMFKYLFLSLITLQPPLRYEYADMKFEDKNIGNNVNHNYIYFDKKIKKFVMSINNDKVINSHGSINLPIDRKLGDIINDTLVNYPRVYLFTRKNKNDEPMGKSNFSNMLKQISPGLGIDIIRSAFITYYYSNNLTLKDKELIANKMRNSVQMAEMNYNKIFKNKNNVINIDEGDFNVPLKNKIKK